jgi:hypothetical protein
VAEDHGPRTTDHTSSSLWSLDFTVTTRHGHEGSLTRKTKELNHERLVTLSLGPLSVRHVEGTFVSFMEQMGIFGVHERSLIEQIA